MGSTGSSAWTVDGKRIDVGPREGLCISRGAIHRFDNNGKADAKALCVVTPAEIGPEYFREVAESASSVRWWAGGSGEDGGDYAAVRAHSGWSDVANVTPPLTFCSCPRV